jgi:3-oxoacyl-[acyl-carrier-protein] synthase-3
MPTLQYHNSRIAGLTCTFPQNERTTSEIADGFGIDSKRIIAMTGIESRRIAPDHMCASDLCADAAERLLDGLSWEPESIDALVFVTQTPDYFLPATACVLQRRLGLANHCASFDVNMGCSGYVYGLYIASSLIESGIQRALLLVGDTSSKFISDQDRSVAFLFGDSGSATAIERKPSRATFVLGTDGGGADHLIIPGGHSRQRATPELCERVTMEGGNIRSPQELYMNGAEVMAFTLREVPPLFDTLLAERGVSREEIDAVVMHQANKFLLDNLARKMDIPADRVPSSVQRYGNTSCASIPVTISECLREAVSESKLRLALMGFGVGWSWAGCITDFDHITAPKANFIS